MKLRLARGIVIVLVIVVVAVVALQQVEGSVRLQLARRAADGQSHQP